MKVINANTEWPKRVQCPHCGVTIEYDEYDLEDMTHGIGFKCPNCNTAIYYQKFEPHQFPKAFYHFGGKDPTCHCSEEEVQSFIDEIAKKLENTKDMNYYTYTATGDTIVFGFKSEEEDQIIVAQNYWEENYNFR